MRTAEEERQFLLERSKAVGGSDVHHLLDLAPHGCRRRLWYDKKGVAADFPFFGNRHTRRGQAVEPHAIEEFCKGEGYRGQAQSWLVHPRQRGAGAHVDHLIWPAGGDAARPGPGVLEVKVPSLRNFYAMRVQGPPEPGRLQHQWNMAMADAAWGVFLAFNADLWAYRFWTYERDDGMVADLLAIAERFWASLDSDRPPWDRLDPRSRQCAECPWRRTCQGITREAPLPEEDDAPADGEQPEEDESFFDVVASYNAAAAVARDADAAKEAAKQALLARLGARPRKVVCGAGRVSQFEVVQPAKMHAEKRYLSLRVVPAKDVRFPNPGEGYGEIED